MGRVSNTEEGNIQNLWYWLVLTSGKKVLLLDPGCLRVPAPLFRKLGATKHWYWQFLHILFGQTWSRAVDWIFYYGPEGSLIIHDILSLKPTNSRNYNSSNWCLKHSFPVQLSTSCPPELLQLVTDRRNGKAERQRVIIRWSLIQSNAARGRDGLCSVRLWKGSRILCWGDDFNNFTHYEEHLSVLWAQEEIILQWRRSRV